MIWILSLVSAFCSIAYTVLVHRPPGTVRTIVKTLATSSLALICWWMDGPALLTVALVLGALGDFFLSLDHETGFLPGLGSFLLGHIALVWLIWPLGGGVGVFGSQPVRLGAALALLLLALFVMRQLWRLVGALRIPVMIYIIVIACMGYAALSLPFAYPYYWIAAGALLFTFSDLLLSQHLFVVPQDHKATPPLAVAVWATYWLAQVAFIIGFLRLF